MKDISGYEGKYAITKDGKVWSYPRKIIKENRWGKSGSFNCKGGWLKSNTNKAGNWYYSIALGRKNRKGFKVHRLIAQAFIPNPLNLPEVNHKNGIKTDNRIENLEWCTRKQNLAHSYKIYPFKMRKMQRGEDSWCHKLTENNVREIKRRHETGTISMRKLAGIYKVSYPTVWGIINKIYWTHII